MCLRLRYPKFKQVAVVLRHLEGPWKIGKDQPTV